MVKKKKTQKVSLTRKILVGLGIPAVFIPGLILASLLGGNWKRDLAKLEQSGGYTQSEVLFPQKAMVVQVIDGDTVTLDNGLNLRLVGVDAPGQGEDFYEEATSYTAKFCQAKTVQLEYDQDQTDPYGRLLAYVWDEGKMLNLELVKKGFAKVVTYEKNKKLIHEDELLAAEVEAKKEKKGIWSY
jgi:endonuclease YncB( thermonuclease family)